MAHVGRFYKVLFRRDLSININSNRFALPEAFLFSASFSASGAPMNSYTITGAIALPTSAPDSDQPEWETPNHSQHGRTFKTRVFLHAINETTGLLEIRFEFIASGIVRATGRPEQLNLGDCRSFDVGFSLGSWVTDDAAYWGGGTIGGGGQLDPAGWSLYP